MKKRLGVIFLRRFILWMGLASLSANLVAGDSDQHGLSEEKALGRIAITLNFSYKNSQTPVATISRIEKGEEGKPTLLVQVFDRKATVDNEFYAKLSNRSSTPAATSFTAYVKDEHAYITKYFDVAKKISFESIEDVDGKFTCSGFFGSDGKILTFLTIFDEDELSETRRVSFGEPKSNIQFYDVLDIENPKVERGIPEPNELELNLRKFSKSLIQVLMKKSSGSDEKDRE